MPDYPGAKAAVRARLDASWTTTRITYQNAAPAPPWPPLNDAGELLPWVNLEIVGTGQAIEATGTRGNRVWSYRGDILVHVYTPAGSGDELATQYATQIGEIFRAAKFYDEVPGYCVRTLAPSIDGGGTGSDDGNWFRVTMTVDFTYWHRA